MRLLILSVMLGLLVSTLLLPTDSLAACSKRQVESLKAKGMTTREIREFCVSDEDDEEEEEEVPVPMPSRSSRAPQPRQDLTNICLTPVTYCALGQFGPMGTPCWCMTPMGPATGMLSR